MLNDRLRRVTDLFVEGAELFLGLDEDQKPVVVWVNKLNSFETDEARRDGVAARGIRIAAMGPESDDCKALKVAMDQWDDRKLAELRAEQRMDELYLKVMNDIETDPEWRERIDLVKRGSQILNDANVPEDDPRREALHEANSQYVTAIREGTQRAVADAVRDHLEQGRKNVEADYIEGWRNAASLDLFIAEQRVTQLYMSLRECKATIVNREGPTPTYDHSACDHAVRLLSSRAEVRGLPDHFIERAVAKLDEVTVDIRSAGNSDAPASSSASSGLSSEEEAVSTPSIPVETSGGAPTT